MYAITRYVLLRELLRNKCITRGQLQDILIVKLPVEGLAPNSSLDGLEGEIDEVIEIYNDYSSRVLGWECIEENEGTICLVDGCERLVRDSVRRMENANIMTGDIISMVKSIIYS